MNSWIEIGLWLGCGALNGALIMAAQRLGMLGCDGEAQREGEDFLTVVVNLLIFVVLGEVGLFVVLMFMVIICYRFAWFELGAVVDNDPGQNATPAT